MLSLDTVTLVSINCLDPEQSIKALNYSHKSINFAKVLLLTDKHIEASNVEIQYIKPITNIKEYNLFCTHELVNYIKTEHCIIVQPDGFIINPELWDNCFLNYDYIGAPWNDFHSREALYKANLLQYFDCNKIPYVVGNGGFSLRSKKILKEVSNLPKLDSSIPEDLIYSVIYRKQLKEKNVNIAPVKIARKFSLEHIIDKQSLTDLTFGFHGRLPHLFHHIEKLNHEN